MFVQPKRPYKAAEHREARRLRTEEGMPMKRIAARLDVSPASVHLWTKDIELTEEQKAHNRAAARIFSAAKCVETARSRRAAYQEEGRRRARERDPLHLAGCMLYWAEGAKGRNSVGFANSDLGMVQFFCRFLFVAMDVPRKRIAMKLNVYTGNGLSVAEIESYWLDGLGLPASCLRKHVVNHFPTSSSGKRRNRLPYGVCTVRVDDTRLVQHIFGAIQEYASVEEPGWLDGPKRKPRRRPAKLAVA